MSQNQYKEFSFSEQMDLTTALRLGSMITATKNVATQEDGFLHFYRSMGKIYNVLEPLEFESELESQITALANSWTDEDGTVSVDEYNPETLEAYADEWYQILFNELDAKTSLPVGDQGFFDVEKAIEHPEKLFSPHVWNSMPERTKKDIRESCRSLAIQCPTASTFLALRAVEDRLRFWYEEEEGGQIDRGAWGTVLKKMHESYGDEDSKPPVLSNLQFLKSKRNEVSHPDGTPDMAEAETTLQRVRGTIKEIYDQVNQDSGDRDKSVDMAQAALGAAGLSQAKEKGYLSEPEPEDSEEN